MRHTPRATLALLAALPPCSLIPALREAAIFDRAHILGGEAWRLASGNLVHFSTEHLVANVLLLGVAGSLLEMRSRGATLVLYVLSAVVIGCALLAFEPRLARFGGASGIACAAVTLLALEWIRDGGSARGMGIATLVLLALKAGWELRTGLSLVALQEEGVVATPLSHAAGITTAWLVFIALQLRRRPAGRTGVPQA